MNRIYSIKKTALSLLVVGLAVGFSAFKSTEKKLTFTNTYYNVSGVIGDQTPANFVYKDPAEHPDADCGTDLAKACHADWTTDSAPSDGQTPAQAQVSGSPTFAGNDSSRGGYNGL